MSMTVDEALNSLNRMKAESPLAGNTCLVLCLCDSGLAYADVDGIELEAGDDGAVARIDVSTAELPEEVVSTQRLLASKYVTSITVTDPDNGLPMELEIRKLDSGAMVGIDGSYLEQDVGPVFSPYDPGVGIDIPDDERLTAATPEELDALELPFDWHQGDDYAYVITTEPPLGLCNKEDRIQCQVLADIPVHPESLFNVDAAGDAARFVADALNAFVSTPEGLERWKEVLAALSK